MSDKCGEWYAENGTAMAVAPRQVVCAEDPGHEGFHKGWAVSGSISWGNGDRAQWETRRAEARIAELRAAQA